MNENDDERMVFEAITMRWSKFELMHLYSFLFVFGAVVVVVGLQEKRNKLH